jgi:small subunit ribosomal protein S1
MTFDDVIDSDDREAATANGVSLTEEAMPPAIPDMQASQTAPGVPLITPDDAVTAATTPNGGLPPPHSNIIVGWNLAHLGIEVIEDIDLGAGTPVIVPPPTAPTGDTLNEKPTPGPTPLDDDWNRAQVLLESQEILETRVTGYNQGGLTVAFGRLRGFIPNSHLSMVPRNTTAEQQAQILSALVGKTIPVRILEVQRKRRRLLLSERLAERAWRDKQRHDLINQLHVGDRITGRVRSITSFGVFVDLGGADGLIHLSELSWHRVKQPQDVVTVGQEIIVEVLRVEPERGRIGLSRKRALANPWDHIEARYRPGQLVTVQVTNMVSFGAFAQIEPGIEGLIHISELSDDYIDHPRQVVQRGQEYTARVLEIDHEHERVSLSLKQAPQWLVAPVVEPVHADQEAGSPEGDPTSA